MPADQSFIPPDIEIALPIDVAARGAMLAEWYDGVDWEKVGAAERVLSDHFDNGGVVPPAAGQNETDTIALAFMLMAALLNRMPTPSRKTALMIFLAALKSLDATNTDRSSGQHSFAFLQPHWEAA